MAAPKRILLVDDDDAFRRSLAEQLREGDGFETCEAASADAALPVLDRTRIDLVLLDVGLPDADGRDLCRRIREAGHVMPVIMLTGADGEADTIKGLDSGANDYVSKPFRLGELLARMRTQLRLFERNEDAVYALGPYTFRPAAKLLHDEARRKKIRLTDKETAILRYLHRRAEAVGRDELLAEVWGYHASVTTHTLETHIYRLRQKIESDPANARLLITTEAGYRLVP